jgi:hypothetical protein
VIEPRIINDRFLRVVRHAIGNQIVQLDFPHPWQNPLDPSDVNADGNVTAADALRVINELGRRAYSDATTKDLNDPLATIPWPGVYFDQSGDGRSTALDALRVINQLARISLGGGEESELPPLANESGHAVSQTASHTTDHDRVAAGEESGWRNSPKPVETVADRVAVSSVSSGQLETERRAASEISQRRVDELLSSKLFVDELFDIRHVNAVGRF